VQRARHAQRSHQGAFCGHFERGLPAQLDGLVDIITVDVPRVPHARHVLVHQEGVARPSHPLALLGLVPQADQLARRVEGRTDEFVFQDRAIVGQRGAYRAIRCRSCLARRRRHLKRRPAARGRGHLDQGLVAVPLRGQRFALCAGGLAAAYGHLSQHRARERERVEDRNCVIAAGGQLRGGCGCDVLAGRDGLGQVALCLIIDAADGGAGQDVVELVEQHQLPGVVQLGQGHGVALERIGGHAPQFRVAQRQLCAAVEPLRLRLRGEGAAVGLEIQLAHVTGLRLAALLHVLEEGQGRGDDGAWDALQVARAAQILQVLARHAAAAVAIAERQHQRRHVGLLPPVAPGLDERLGRGLVGVAVEDVRPNLSAVHALPDELVVGEGVCRVVLPHDLLRAEVLQPAALHDLGQRRGIAEHIGFPEDLAVDAELVLEEALAVDELADETLAGGDVRVRLDPRRAFGNHVP